MGARYVTMADIAEQYSLAIITIRKWISEGKLTAYRVGKRSIRLDPEQVEREIVRIIPTVGTMSGARKTEKRP